MSFLYPAFLIGALALAIPIALHLLRRDVAQEVPFTAVRLLRRSSLEQPRRRKLRDPLLLAMRVAALLLLAAVFARPFVVATSGEDVLHIVAVDRSYSMGAEGRFEQALGLARDAVDAAPQGARVAVVAFDDRAEVLAGPARAAEARAALDGLAPGYGATRYAPLITRALDLAGAGAARLDIVGDMQRSGWEAAGPVPVPAHLRLRLHAVPLPSANAAVTGVWRVEDGVVASIAHSAEHPLSGTATLVVDGRAVAEAPFAVPAAGSIDLAFKHPLPAGGAAAVRIEDPGGFPADDVRYLVLDPVQATQVVLAAEQMGQAGLYMTRALEASGSREGMRVRASSPAALGRVAPQDWADVDAVVLLSTRGLDRRAREALAGFVTGGGGVLVAASGDVDPSVLAQIFEWPEFAVTEDGGQPTTLAITDLRHPIFHPLGALTANVGHVRFDRIWHVRGDGWDIAARFSGGAPALLERRHGEGRVLIFASDLDRRWNDFPLHPSFVLFALEAVRHVAARPVLPRDYLVAEAPAGAGQQPGVFTLRGDGRRVAVNVDLREHSLAAMGEDEFLAMVPADETAAAAAAGVPPVQAEAAQSLWRYGLLLLLGVLLAESFVGRAR